jgi:hypothetical protein
MSTEIEQDDLPKILARALLCAWEQYCKADLIGRLSEELARPFLKGFLVGSAREGMTDEGQLAAAGLRYLISLTRKPTSSKRSTKVEKKTHEAGRRQPLYFCINGAQAKLLPHWRIRWGSQRLDKGTGNVVLSRR